jgi:two-component system OmpR family response regulator
MPTMQRPIEPPAPSVTETDRNVALVVDDDPDTRLRIRAILRAAGWRVYEAADAERGLNLAREYVPDVILLDLALPRMSGLEMLRELKSTRWADQPTPVVVVSAFAMLMRLHDLRLADATVQKPFASRELLDQLACALGRRRPVLA